MSKAVLTALRKATKGLLYMSEKDAPFKVISTEKLTAPTTATIAEILHQPTDSPVEEVAFTKFFAELTKPQKWHAEDDKAVIKRYQDLLAAMREHLTGLKVFKIGKVRVKIAILGQSESKEWMGLETDSLET